MCTPGYIHTTNRLNILNLIKNIQRLIQMGSGSRNQVSRLPKEGDIFNVIRILHYYEGLSPVFWMSAYNLYLIDKYSADYWTS